MKNNCVTLILAGGNSSRMNYPKPFLKIAGRTFVSHIAGAYITAGVTNIILVLNSTFLNSDWKSHLEQLPASVKIVPNLFPEKDRLYSIQTGLAAAPDAGFCFIHNADSPLISPETIVALWNNRKADGAVIPVFKNKKGHPILLSLPIMRRIKPMAPGDKTLKDVLRHFPQTCIETDDKAILLNVNTPEEYENINRMPILSNSADIDEVKP